MLLRTFQRFLDACRQLIAILLAQLYRPPRQRVLVAAAAGDEKGSSAGMLLLKGNLREAGVVSAPLVEAERGVVTGVAEDDGEQLAVHVFDGQYRNAVIDRPFEFVTASQNLGNLGFF